MQADDLFQHGAQIMTVCNACRYCEQYCPVFPAMEQRLVFEKKDLTYLANLCHNCGECLYACQYAPPHEFGIDVPHTLAGIRYQSYEAYAWPGWLAAAFARRGAVTALVLMAICIAALLGAVLATNSGALGQRLHGHFYTVIPHRVLVAVFGGVGLAVLGALIAGCVRCWRDLRPPDVSPSIVGRALADALSLRHLHSAGVDCVSGEEQRTPWRRWWHHATFYGFLLCFASTTVAALYHAAGFEAPYGYASVPVVLGTLGGAGLIVGPVGLWQLRRRRDPALADAQGTKWDDGLVVLLAATSGTGLLLLALRSSPLMGVLLIVHLGSVLALFITLPYGKFVHGLYRLIALVRSRWEMGSGVNWGQTPNGV